MNSLSIEEKEKILALPKEELIKLINQKEGNIKEDNRCKYKPIRSNQKECNLQAITKWGYCKKHSRTVQARKAEEKYLQSQKKEKELREEEDKIREEIAAEESKLINNIPIKRGMKRPVTQKKIIKPNDWGRYEDTDTGIVFDPKTTCAYGVQKKSGIVVKLSNREIRICKKNGWKYTNPRESSEEESESSEEFDNYYNESTDEESETDDDEESWSN